MRRIGIMGGTFNPIHIGHLMLAECAREELSLEAVWFIPTGHSYMKSNNKGDREPAPAERLEMTRLAVEGNPYFRCLDIEIQREGNTYTYETLEELNRLYPDTDFYFIFGADCLYGIENWKEPGRIFAACEIVAAVREDFAVADMWDKIAQLQKRYDARIHFLPFREMELSSTDIRDRLCQGKSIRYMVPEQVSNYIEEKGFYRV